ncbi:MAG: MFS transporter, partial [Proteobacteria bacterium]|nr:MFS transporter [Pseudomonadota bacterium]
TVERFRVIVIRSRLPSRPPVLPPPETMPPVPAPRIADRHYALIVAAASLLMLFVANGALFMLVVAMKDIAATFDWPRSVPSTAYSLQFIGGGLGGIVMGWWLDRAGMGKPALLGALTIGSGAILVSQVDGPLELWAIYGLLIGLIGNATMFSPLVTNITRWFGRNRGMAVGIVTSGQSLAGFLWPPVFELGIGAFGWRDTYLYYGLFALVTMVPLSLVLRRRSRRRRCALRPASMPMRPCCTCSRPRCSPCSAPPSWAAASPCRCPSRI